MSLTLKLALSPLLVAQALRTRARVPRLPEAAGAREGHTGLGHGPPLRLLVLGDSSAAGVGVKSQRDALADPLARELARRSARRVEWRLIARSGVTTAGAIELLEQVHEGLVPPEVAVAVSGVNDVIDQVPSSRAVHHRERLTNLLRNRFGARHVVFCPLPPIERFPALPQPLRWAMGADAQRHNRALRDWVADRAARLGDVSLLPPEAIRLDDDAIAADGFHPGKLAYRAVVEALVEHIAAWAGPSLTPAEQR